ncbi:MAG: hypothetical protein LBD70_08640 [Bifidobacteriaceae bacterium]|jgi:alternate signal-mediated exported protein|nr:hypothetical protein [Bifidobacteriaceae bacterium]
MTITPRTDNERRSRRIKGLVAGVAGVALLLGGSTFAFWSDQVGDWVGDITNGVLDIDVNAETHKVKAFDLRNTVSSAAEGYGTSVAGGETLYKELTLANFKAVPGDELEIDIPFKLIAVGDNMKYELQVQSSGDKVVDLAAVGWTAKGQLYDPNGNALGTGEIEFTSIPGASGSGAGFVTLAEDVTATTGDAGAVYTLVIKATLPDSVGETANKGQEHQNVAAALGTLNLKVQQIDIK